MANIAIFRINYKSDFILTLNSDAGWMTPFCIKFWTGAPSQAYFVGFDGTTYTHCAPVDGDPTKLQVQFDDHHLPIGDLKFQIAYHFTVADFPTSVEDEVLNQASVIIEVDDAPAQVMLDLNGETAPEIEFSLPAYANEAQRIANEQARIAAEQQRIANEDARIQAEETRQYNEQQRIQHEEYRVSEFARLKSESEAATSSANTAATLANEKAQLAADKAALAQAAATLAIDQAQLAADKAALAQAAATLANDKAALAQQKAAYAQTQGDYAKAQGDYAKAQGDTAQADHERAEADHTTAAADHQTAAADHTTAASDHSRAEADHTTASSDHTRAESDHTTASSDHTRAESDHTTAAADHTTAQADHTRAESDHAAVEMYVDSLGVFDLSKHNAVGGVLATYADLDAALNALNALDSKYKYGGMSFKFVLTSDNKYVQYFLPQNEWSIDPNDWEKINLEEEITEINNELVSQRIGEITPRIISGLIALSGSSVFQANGNKRILAVQVKVGDKIKLQYPAGFLNICWSEKLPVLNGSYSGFYSTRNQSSTYDALIYEVTSEIDGYLCVSAGNTYNVKFYKDNNTYAVDVKDELVNLQNQVDWLQGELVEGDSITIKTGVIEGFCAHIAGYLVPRAGYKAVVFFARANKYYLITIGSTVTSYIGRTLFYPYPNCTITNYTTTADREIWIHPTTDTYIIVCVPTATTVAVTITNTYIGKDVFDLKAGLVQTNESVEELDGGLTNLNKTFNEQVLNDNELITIPYETTTGVIISPNYSTVQANTDFNIYAIPVTQGDTIFVTCNRTASGNMSFCVGYTESIPATGVSCYDVILKERTRWTDEEVVASRLGYYCVCCNDTIDIIAFKCLNTGLARRVKVLEDIVPHEGTLDMTSKIITPSTVYELYPNNAFVALNRIYVEGITASSDSDFNNSLMVNGRKNRFITNPAISATTKEYNISLLLSADGYEDKTITVPIRRTQPSNAKNKTINVMCIGDSLTQGGYPAIVEYIFKRLNDTQSDTSATMIGTKLLNVEIEYNGITKTCRGCHEGKGGAGISDYMRHLFMVRGSGTDSRYGMTISGKAAWDSLGLGTKTRNGSAGQPYETYTGSAAQKELMRTTCHGYYDADPSQELWNWRSVCYPEYGTFTYDGTTYTFGSSYSSDENAKIIAFVKWMCESNNFGTRRLSLYDKDTVESSNGQYAFSLSKYIDRFKTLANDGITRLVVGDTAGTLVTNVNSYDVCKPTHVIIIMNHNDLVQYGNVSGVISDLCLMADLVKEYDSNIHIALGSNRAYGAIDPKVYYDTIGMVGTFGANFANLRDFYVALKDCGTHGDILNIYQTATVKGACYQAVDTLTHADATLYNASDTFTHTQLESYLDRAYQIAAWVISGLES